MKLAFEKIKSHFLKEKANIYLQFVIFCQHCFRVFLIQTRVRDLYLMVRTASRCSDRQRARVACYKQPFRILLVQVCIDLYRPLIIFDNTSVQMVL